MSGVAGNLRAGDDVDWVRVLDGDNDDVRTTLRSESFDVRGSAAFIDDQVRDVGDLLRRDWSPSVLGRGHGLKCGLWPDGFWLAAAARAAACMYAGSAIVYR